MNFFRPGIRQKLLLLVALSTLALIGSVWYMLLGDYKLMQTERKIMLSNINDNVYAEAEALNKDVIAGRLTKPDAIKQLHDLMDTLRFGPARDYSFGNFTSGVSFANAGNPAAEGKDLFNATGPDGRKPVAEIVTEAKAHGGGSLRYLWPRPKTNGGLTEPVPKLAVFKLFAPFDLVISTGVYIDDIDAAFNARLASSLIILGTLILATIAVTLLIARSIQRPLNRLANHMDALAQGNVDIAIAETARTDEIGDMARTVEVFRANAIEVRRLHEVSEATKRQTETDRKATMHRLADDMDRSINSLASSLAIAADTMQDAAKSMTLTAEEGQAVRWQPPAPGRARHRHWSEPARPDRPIPLCQFLKAGRYRQSSWLASPYEDRHRGKPGYSRYRTAAPTGPARPRQSGSSSSWHAHPFRRSASSGSAHPKTWQRPDRPVDRRRWPATDRRSALDPARPDSDI